MPGIAEYVLAFRGCARLLRFDPGGLLFFDRSAAGARRSFGIAIPIYLYFLLQIIGAGILEKDIDLARYFAAMSLGYVFLWIAFPLALLGIANFFEWRDRAPGAISVYNWASLLTVAVHSPSLVLELGDWLKPLAGLLDYAALAYMLTLNTFIFRRVLGIAILPAVALVFGDFVLSQIFILPTFNHLGQIGW